MKKLNKKCILLCRVSTANQDIEQQTEKVKQEAIKDGFKEDDLIILEDVESAVLLDETERNGLNQLKRIIETDNNISTVYCYEVSRISRRPKVLYSIRDFLIEHKVQLIVLNPYMKMLKDNGTISETANIFFGIFSSMAENEGYIRKARMKRGIEKKKSSGKYAGGSIAIGYTIDKNDNFIIDPEGAAIVQRIFTEYVNGKSTRKLARDLQDEGWRRESNFLTIVQSVSNILHREYYTGNDGRHPAIISMELYKAAQNKCSSSRVYNRKKYECLLLKGLIYDKKSGLLLSGNRVNKQYYCKRTKGAPTINANVIDPIIWTLVCRLHAQRFVFEREKWVADLDLQIERCDKIINTMKSNIEKELAINERIEERYIEGHITKDKANELEKKHHKLILEYSEKLKSTEELIVKLKSDKVSYNSKIEYSNMSLFEKIDLVNQCISKIFISRENRFIANLEVMMKWGNVYYLTINTRLNKVLNEIEKILPTLGYEEC